VIHGMLLVEDLRDDVPIKRSEPSKEEAEPIYAIEAPQQQRTRGRQTGSCLSQFCMNILLSNAAKQVELWFDRSSSFLVLFYQSFTTVDLRPRFVGCLLI